MIDKGETGKEEAFWSYWFPLGILDEAIWEQVEFIFFDEGRIHAETVTVGRYSEGARRDAESRHAQREAFSKEEIDALASEPRK